MVNKKTVDLEDFEHLYNRIDWFLEWLMSCEPDTIGYIYQEWFRSNPSNTRTWAKGVIEKAKSDSNGK